MPDSSNHLNNVKSLKIFSEYSILNLYNANIVQIVDYIIMSTSNTKLTGRL